MNNNSRVERIVGNAKEILMGEGSFDQYWLTNIIEPIAESGLREWKSDTLGVGVGREVTDYLCEPIGVMVKSDLLPLLSPAYSGEEGRTRLLRTLFGVEIHTDVREKAVRISRPDHDYSVEVDYESFISPEDPQHKRLNIIKGSMVLATTSREAWRRAKAKGIIVGGFGPGANRHLIVSVMAMSDDQGRLNCVQVTNANLEALGGKKPPFVVLMID